MHTSLSPVSLRGTQPYMGIRIMKEIFNSLYPKHCTPNIVPQTLYPNIVPQTHAQHHAFLLGQELVRLGIPDVHVDPVDDPEEFVHVGSY